MEPKEKVSLAELVAHHNVIQVDTTSSPTGYPERLRIAYTADTMAELRALKDAAEADGHRVDVVALYRCDGWALWHRMTHGDLDDEAWTQPGVNGTFITMNMRSCAEQEAFNLIAKDRTFDALDELRDAIDRVEDLASDLPDPSELKEGQQYAVQLDDNLRVQHYVKTGDTGYSYDTHNYCTALLIEEAEQDEE